MYSLRIKKTYFKNGRPAGQMFEYTPSLTPEQAAQQLTEVGYNTTTSYLNHALESKVERHLFLSQLGTTQIDATLTRL